MLLQALTLLLQVVGLLGERCGWNPDPEGKDRLVAGKSRAGEGGSEQDEVVLVEGEDPRRREEGEGGREVRGVRRWRKELGRGRETCVAHVTSTEQGRVTSGRRKGSTRRFVAFVAACSPEVSCSTR
eukprot:751142-Hanusia_phi.AAC.1